MFKKFPNSIFENRGKIRPITDKVNSWIDQHEFLFPGNK